MVKIFPLTQDNVISSKEQTYNSGKSPQLYVFSSSYDYRTGKLQGEIIENKSILNFDSSKIFEFVSGSNFDIQLQLHVSDFVVKNPYVGVVASPLMNSFVEGNGYFFDSTLDSNWIRRNSIDAWVFTGGDIDDNIVYNSIYSDIERTYTFDLNHYFLTSSFVTDNFGISLYTTCSVDDSSYKGGLQKCSFYSKDTRTEYIPYVIAFVEETILNTGSAELFRDGNIIESNFSITPKPFKNKFPVGENLFCFLNITEISNPANFWYPTTTYYLEDIQYEVRRKSNNALVIPFNNMNTLPVNNGNYINFSTEYFLKGKYVIRCRYSNDNVTVYSKPIEFELI